MSGCALIAKTLDALKPTLEAQRQYLEPCPFRAEVFDHQFCRHPKCNLGHRANFTTPNICNRLCIVKAWPCEPENLRPIPESYTAPGHNRRNLLGNRIARYLRRVGVTKQRWLKLLNSQRRLRYWFNRTVVWFLSLAGIQRPQPKIVLLKSCGCGSRQASLNATKCSEPQRAVDTWEHYYSLRARLARFARRSWNQFRRRVRRAHSGSCER